MLNPKQRVGSVAFSVHRSVRQKVMMSWLTGLSLAVARRTPLHAAAFAEDVAGLQLVLRHGAEINTVDKSGRSALMVAADKGHSGTVGECEPALWALGWNAWTEWVQQCLCFGGNECLCVTQPSSFTGPRLT